MNTTLDVSRTFGLVHRILHRLSNFVAEHDLGLVAGPKGPFQLQDSVYCPSGSFIPWSALPDGEIPKEAIWRVAQSLVVHVLCDSNTHAEMVQKWAELTELGTKVMWLIDPATSSAEIWRPGADAITLDLTGVLDAAPALHGFTLPLADVFASLRLKRNS